MDKPLKILFLVPHSIEGASYRYRVHHYLPYLKNNNIRYRVSPFVSKTFYKILYRKGHLFQKIFHTGLGMARRLKDIVTLPFYDVIFVHLESLPFPILWIERLARQLKKPIIFDFDDAIFLKRENATSRFRDRLKSHEKTPKMIQMSSHVIVCNDYLKTYCDALTPTPKTTVIPTSIDTHLFSAKKQVNAQLTLGWIGSHTTYPYFKSLRPVFERLAKKHKFTLKVIGAPEAIEIPGVTVKQVAWNLQQEVNDFHSIDIGVYPLYDSEWAKGKAAFKALQYMAAQVPYVASKVGRNAEVIEEGVNGFLAATSDEWVEKLERLITSPELRQKMGAAGRQTIEKHFSTEIHAPSFIQILRQSVQQ